MKKMTFDELNIAIVESVGLVVDEGGYILTDSGKNLTMNKLKIVIPTIANVKNKNEIIDGVITPKYTRFNPYSEDEIKRNQMLVLLMKNGLILLLELLVGNIESCRSHLKR